MQWVIRDVSLGSNIQNIRLRSGLTQDQLIAKNADKGKQYVTQHIGEYRSRTKKYQSI